ncbi:hypothetical protein BMA1212 [Burkholderia mallei ATCC 23344]|uniref:Uncharacterized protein n=2 Tax=pseudomallei group TaxID=111527 RepID=A0A0E1VYT7_BURPE|nr:hypothetical protein BMA1212 [Burkholderia mallei ATCC 23344]ABN82805.1 conserved hypothetical protein [Burkholderia pseudomallei 668]ACQ97432.1 conserved hypothetical protein [Burkholderia pseudomallei MSHR346]EDU07481.1 conserved hypothetical protein [Burkholderia pseudomallei 1655]EEP84093.1 conserved hypothetical protein [Burkholderia mallei GB8 horse 4]EES43019.1 conserved hypothetical protein [Burkholderia mallei PRL-20]EET06058.1 conserved hypothetical protein [Burkholderia pseudoma
MVARMGGDERCARRAPAQMAQTTELTEGQQAGEAFHRVLQIQSNGG